MKAPMSMRSPTRTSCRRSRTREETFNLRFRHATGELENTAGLSGSRRDVARLLTIARERGIDVTKELK